jgi:hypothetical protein
MFDDIIDLWIGLTGVWKKPGEKDEKSEER